MVGLSIQIDEGIHSIFKARLGSIPSSSQSTLNVPWDGNMRDNELLTVKEVAAFLRVSRVTVWRWCQRGIIPASRLGRNWRIRRDDLLALLESPICLPPANSNQYDGSIQKNGPGVQPIVVVVPESDENVQTTEADPEETSDLGAEQG